MLTSAHDASAVSGVGADDVCGCDHAGHTGAAGRVAAVVGLMRAHFLVDLQEARRQSLLGKKTECQIRPILVGCIKHKK